MVPNLLDDLIFHDMAMISGGIRSIVLNYSGRWPTDNGKHHFGKTLDDDYF
jgi:hypothetical protein